MSSTHGLRLVPPAASADAQEPQDPAAAGSAGGPLTVIRLEVDAVKRLLAARLAPTPHGLVCVRGRNANGKSSLLDAMEAALRGPGAAGDLPITEGQHGARTLVDLGDLVIKRTWTRDSAGKAKSKLVVENAQGVQQIQPQGLLDKLCGSFADPVAFLARKPQEQVETVLRVLGLDEELRRLEGLEKDQFELRRDLGRDADKARKAAQQLTEEVGLFGVDNLPEVGNAEALAAELQAAKDHNAALAAIQQAKGVAEAAGKAAGERVKKIKLDIERAQAEVKRLEGELEKTRAEVQVQASAWKEASATLAQNQPIDVGPIVAAIGDIEAVQRRRSRIELLGSAEAEAEKRAQLHAEAEAGLEEIRGQVAALLGTAQFPVDGMSYDPEAKALTLSGIPFSQASHAERLKASAAIAMAGNPRIRVFFIRDGSMLDSASLAIIAQMAEERNFQVWVEIVADENNGQGIWIEDGEAISNEP